MSEFSGLSSTEREGVESEEPTLLQMMMAEQRKAALAKFSRTNPPIAAPAATVTGTATAAAPSVDTQARPMEAKVPESSSKAVSSGGFKKGFLSGSSSSSSSSSSTLKSAPKKGELLAPTNKSVLNITGSGGPSSLSSSSNSSAARAPLLTEVQAAMQEEQSPFVQKLRSNEWMSDELMERFKGNPVLLAGFQNPRCVQALEQMQKNPTEALKSFQSDPEIAPFIREFSGVMASHFEKLGEQQGQAQTTTTTTATTTTATVLPGDSLGPLHQSVLERSKEPMSVPKPKASLIQEYTPKSAEEIKEEERVQEVLADEELRELLMDKEMQQILVECGDPVKFRRHMNNPATAYKIRRLYEAGLVGTAK